MEKIRLFKNNETVMHDLQKYSTRALELGCSDTKIIEANQIIIDERVKMKCRVPRCTNFAECANCPPFTPETEQMKRAIGGYTYAVLLRHDVNPVIDFVDKKRLANEGKKHYKKLNNIVSKIEKAAFHDGYYLALGFSGGSCKHYLCDSYICQYLDSKKCKYNLLARPSMESVGIDVFNLVTKVGWDIYPIGGSDLPISEIPCAAVIGIVFVC